MENLIFILILAGILTILLTWGFRYLPDEKWQILAVTPRKKMNANTWNGINLTFYGLFNALAYSFGAGMLILLLASAEMPIAVWLPLIACILGICVPASKIIARIVEKKPSTFTVAGASFVGMLITPLLVAAINITIGEGMGFSVPLVPVMAALGIAYAFGEGIGRLACISFGCCYGRPISEFPEKIQRLITRFCFVFSGKTKKIAYAHGLDGQKVLPVQAVTSVIFCLDGLLGVC
ncbi:MAG: prolipoprotein diacylglyceryl transferase, partial [Desulfatirhabdiaceae bacterium]